MKRFIFRFSYSAFYLCLLVATSTMWSDIALSQVVKNNDKLLSIDSTLKDDSLMDAEILPYRVNAEKTMNEVLAYSDMALRNHLPEGTIGDFMADLVMKKANAFCADSCQADMCLLNDGGMRNPLPKGNITRGNVFQLMPFENEIVILTLKGSDVKEMLNYIATQGGEPVSGLRMKIKNNMPADVMIGGKPFDENKTYQIVTSDYLANGGDNMAFLSKAIRRVKIGMKLRDAIINYLVEESKKGNSINVKTDGRIQVVK